MSNINETFVVDAAVEVTELTSVAKEPDESVFQYVKEAEIADAIENNTTTLQHFYKGQRIFITGGTGFLGCFLIRRLLLICPDIDCIYVLMRPKNQDIKEREHELVFNEVFKGIDFKNPEVRKKIVAIEGDCTQPQLGLSLEDRKLLSQSVSIVFHVAGTSPTEKNLITSTVLDCRSTLELINLCKRMKLLRSVIYVSSAHSQFPSSHIKERFYNFTCDYFNLVNFMQKADPKKFELVLPHLMAPWTSAHLFSKAMAEDIIAGNTQELPLGIFRPGLLTPSIREPKSGWCKKGEHDILTGIIARTMRGYLMFLRANVQARVNFVPVDFAANALIACAHDVALRYNASQERNEHIYNFVSTLDAPQTWSKIRDLIIERANKYPYSESIGTSLLLANDDYSYSLVTMLQRHIIAKFLDFRFYLDYRRTGVNEAEEADMFARGFSVYGSYDWNYGADNMRRVMEQMMPKEKELCDFEMRGLDWENYMTDVVMNVREQVLNDPPWTVVQARQRMKTIEKVIMMVKILLGYMIYYVLYKIIVTVMDLFYKKD